ncbi:hypothetical protein ACSBR2_016287 [Camellia fascicularis]
MESSLVKNSREREKVDGKIWKGKFELSFQWGDVAQSGPCPGGKAGEDLNSSKSIALPLIGSIHYLASSLPHHSLQYLAKKYGPLMHIQLGEISTIVISSPIMAKEVLKKHDLAFENRPDLLAGTIMTYDKLDIAFSSYGDY